MILPHVLDVEPVPDVLSSEVFLLADVTLAQVIVKALPIRKTLQVELGNIIHERIGIHPLLSQLI